MTLTAIHKATNKVVRAVKIVHDDGHDPKLYLVSTVDGSEPFVQWGSKVPYLFHTNWDEVTANELSFVEEK